MSFLPIGKPSFSNQSRRRIGWLALGFIVLSVFAGACPFEQTGLAKAELVTSYRSTCEDNPDLSKLEGQPVEILYLWKSNVRDLAPLEGLPIRDLTIFGCPISDLSALEGMPLEKAWIGATEVEDFSPLKGAPLRDLSLFVSEVTDISFLEGMPLEVLDLSVVGTGRVTNLRPLRGMNLKVLQFGENTVTQGMDVIRGMESLEKINNQAPEEFWKQYDAEAPIRKRFAEAGVRFRSLYASDAGNWSLVLAKDDLKDLSLLKGMPIGSIELYETGIEDYSALREMELSYLRIEESNEPDLTTLQGLTVRRLALISPKVNDISALKGLPLESLSLRCKHLKNLSGLEGMELKSLDLLGCPNVENLSALQEASVDFLSIDLRTRPKAMEALKKVESLVRINGCEVEVFWQSYDEGDLEGIGVPSWMLGWD